MPEFAAFQGILRDRFQALLETTSDGFWCVSSEGVITEVNDVYLRVSGYSREALLGRPVHEIDEPDSRDDVQRRVTALEELGSQRFLSRHRSWDGHLRDVEVSLTRVPATGEIMSFFREISPQLESAQRLRESEERFATVFRLSP